jgi:hypothetical protein
MVYFHTKTPNLGKFWWALEWKMLVYLMVIWNILWTFGNVVVIWYNSLILVNCIKKNLATLVSNAAEKTGN